jgi:SOS-response transcriptional repressor LexA
MNVGETTGDRLRRIRKDRGLTQEKLAELAEVTQNSISAYEMNKANMSLDVARKISKVLGVSLDGLVGIGLKKKTDNVVREGLLDWDTDLEDSELDDEPPYDYKASILTKDALILKLKAMGYEVKPVNKAEMRSIPILGRVTAGIKNPAEAIEYIQGWVDTDLPESVEFALRVTGDSMEPSIPDGSIVFVDKSKTAHNGNICVVIINGSDAVIKRTYFDPNGVMLRSENLKYEPSFIDREHWESECRIVGVVVRHQVDHI